MASTEQRSRPRFKTTAKVALTITAVAGSLGGWAAFGLMQSPNDAAAAQAHGTATQAAPQDQTAPDSFGDLPQTDAPFARGQRWGRSQDALQPQDPSSQDESQQLTPPSELEQEPQTDSVTSSVQPSQPQARTRSSR